MSRIISDSSQDDFEKQLEEAGYGNTEKRPFNAKDETGKSDMEWVYVSWEHNEKPIAWYSPRTRSGIIEVEADERLE